jgi:plasmid stabilization system protein ParE
MMYKIILDQRAIQEADDAYVYYEGKQIGLGEKFKKELENTIKYVCANPKHFKKIKRESRQALINRFPYLVIYEIFDEVILISAIFHASRNPVNKFNT